MNPICALFGHRWELKINDDLVEVHRCTRCPETLAVLKEPEQ